VRSDRGPARRREVRLEWPTLAVLAGVYAGFGLLTWFYDALPWWLIMPLAGYILCLHGSLQHEAIHGHPTGLRWLDEALVTPSLWLWMPLRIYREQHLAHHQAETLADPLADPESYYLPLERWHHLGTLARSFLWARNTLAGRLLLGPLESVARLYGGEAARLLRGDTSNLGHWVLHLVAVAPVLVWSLWVCGISLGGYLLLFVYPGLSLMLLRSYLEHQANAEAGRRTVVIESGPLFSLLFLNNNLHALHHAEPGLAWYRLPARYRLVRERLLAENGGYFYAGYRAIAARYLLRAKEAPAYAIGGTA
jgi:fatty acid desaturase